MATSRKRGSGDRAGAGSAPDPEKDNPGKNPADNRGALSGAPVALESREEDLQALDSDFEDLFGDGSENVVVELIRTDPRFFAGRRVGGFLCHLPPGSTKETIRESYGGGQYRVVKKGSGGRIVAQKSVAIAGEPMLPSNPAAALPGASSEIEAAPRSANLPVQTTAGIPIGIANSEFLAMAQQLALVRSMFPDINSEIMKAMLNRPAPQQQNFVELAGQLITLVNQFREIVPPVAESGGGGSDWLGILREGIAAFSSYMKAQSARPAPPRPAFGKAAGDLPALDAVDRPALPMNPPDPAPASSPNPEGNEVLSIQAFVDKAAALIAGGYLMRKTPAEIVSLLELAIPLPSAMRSSFLEPHRSALKDYCEISLADDFVEDPELQAGFADYFKEIFDRFVGAGA